LARNRMGRCKNEGCPVAKRKAPPRRRSYLSGGKKGGRGINPPVGEGGEGRAVRKEGPGELDSNTRNSGEKKETDMSTSVN